MREEEEEVLEGIGESEPEEDTRFITNIFTRRTNSESEDEFEHPLDIHTPEGLEEDRWWSPEPPQPSTEEDEEEVRYLVQILDLEPWRIKPVLERTASGPKGRCYSTGHTPEEKATTPQGHKTEEAEKEGGEDQRSGVGAGQAGRLAEGDA
jgi:hypothetical protein